MTLLLLLLMAGLLAYSAQQQVSELRIQASEFRQREALSQAEADLARAMALLMHYRQAAPTQALWPTLVSVESQALPTLANRGWLWQLSARRDGPEAHVVVRRQLLATPLLLRRPLSGRVVPPVGPADEGSAPLDYLFGFTSITQALTTLTPLATQHLQACHALDSQSHGLLLIDGHCVLHGQIGSATQPVLLVLSAGELQLAADATLYGLLLLLGDERGTLQAEVGARLHGALVSPHPLPAAALDIAIEHSPEILTQLQNSPLLMRFELVEGSWRDW